MRNLLSRCSAHRGNGFNVFEKLAVADDFTHARARREAHGTAREVFVNRVRCFFALRQTTDERGRTGCAVAAGKYARARCGKSRCHRNGTPTIQKYTVGFAENVALDFLSNGGDDRSA